MTETKTFTSISEKRIESVIRRLDLKKPRPSKKRFIIVQIDSLPYSLMKKFIEKGYCRFLKKLVEKEGYHLQKFNCGIPSGTPSVQAGIMYGDNSMIPGFRFVDKEGKRQFSFGNPNHVKHIEKTYFSDKKGILEGGSSYSNNFSGGAERSILTMSTITAKKRFKRIKESNLWLFLLLHPASSLRVLYYSIAELVIEIADILSHPLLRLLKKKKNAIFGFRIPFRRLLMNAILAELITLGVIIDIRRNVPKIYINYLNYDDIAHLRGPDSLAARFIANALDRRVKRIYKKAGSNYDFFVISDHGQVDSVPFRAKTGMTLAEFIEKSAKVESFEFSSLSEGRLSVMGIVLKKTVYFLNFVSSPLRWTGTVFIKMMMKVVNPGESRFVWEDKEKIFVSDSCCLAHVYLNSSKRRMELRQINKKYPSLIKSLVSNSAIGIVMVKQGEDIVLMNKEGKIIIGNTVSRKGKSFLDKYGDEDILIKQLRDFNALKFVGDIVLFGNYENGVAVSFTDHVGAHGGIGGDMMYPFFISKKRYDLDGICNSRELHKIFQNY